MFIHVNVIYIMYTFIKSTYCSYYVAIQKRVSSIQLDFGYPRVLVLGINFDPNRCLCRVRILSSDFSFGCLNTPPDPNSPVAIPSRTQPYSNQQYRRLLIPRRRLLIPRRCHRDLAPIMYVNTSPCR